MRPTALRFLVFGALSILLMVIQFLVLAPLSPGYAVAQMVVANKPPSFLGDLGEAVGVAAIVDFMVWFVFLWGMQLRERVRTQGVARHWINPLKPISTPITATLCAVPLSYYLLLAKARLIAGGLVATQSEVIASTALSLVICATAICVLYSVFGRFWTNSIKKTRS